MPLIECPECKRQVSDQASACIHCGYPLKAPPKEQEFGGHVPVEASGPAAYEFHTVRRRFMKWNAGPLDQVRTVMSEAGWEFVGERDLLPANTPGNDRHVEMTFRRVKRPDNPPVPALPGSGSCPSMIVALLFCVLLTALLVGRVKRKPPT